MEEVPALPDDILELGRKVAPRIAFLVGCARSGTSILGEAIAEHPQVTYLFEVSSIWNDLVPERPDHRLSETSQLPGYIHYFGLPAGAAHGGTGPTANDEDPGIPVKHLLNLG